MNKRILALITVIFITSLPASLSASAVSKPSNKTKTQPKSLYTLPLNAKPGQIWKCPRDGSSMVFVPAGEFTMGGYNDMTPAHKRTLAAYWIDKCEVTNAQFTKFVTATGYTPEGLWQEEEVEGKDQYPIQKVTWKDANAYAKWAGKRLPTEAEWERAARGNDARLYPWGNEWHAEYAVLGKKTDFDVEPVGSHPNDISPVGCLDMAGNVQEWCFERFSETAYTRYIKGDKSVPPLGTVFCIRGACADSGNEKAKCNYRFWATPGWTIGGFRCVIGPDPKLPLSKVDYPCEYNPEPNIYRTTTPPKKPKAGDVWICPKNNSEMVYVPAGEYKASFGDKLHTATTGAFWISRYPITVEAFRTFVKKTGYEPLPYWECYDQLGDESYPAMGICCEDAEAYAKWIGQRLPKPNEWEKAARGTDGRSYPCKNLGDGDIIPFYYKPLLKTVPIGTRPKNKSPYGVWDMASHNYEWVDHRKIVDGRTCKRQICGIFRGDWPSEIWLSIGSDGKTYSSPSAFPLNNPFRCVLDAK